eukprot:GEMP01054150.1.p1 GENE.GEMP01054150.1~~GEMP01054150.1.p1  ORF type:complete len:189 (+),score=23.39 GEMP01054150.1:194-760(+)
MVTVDQVVELRKPTDAFLCALDANVYSIDFVAFKIRSLDANTAGTIFEIRKDPSLKESEESGQVEPATENGDERGRTIRYHFGSHFLDYQTIGTELEFTIGSLPVRNFRMIERHYFRERIIKSFDFTLPFCIPNTTNTWEVIYSMPQLELDIRESIIANPWETRSDSFYFVENILVMHNKAEYNYSSL